MALFEREETDFGTDVGTRALSVIAVENHFVERVYEKLASSYDLFFGPTLHPGRLVARDRMGITPYPSNCHVTGIDLSSSMLDKARERVAREGIRNVRLLEMDAAKTTFADDTFDIVYAPYLISVVPDPVMVAREMRRICKPGGKIIILNHFRSANPVLSRVERAISPFTVHIGFKSDLDLPAFLAQAELRPESIEKVNVPKIWSLVTCVK